MHSSRTIEIGSKIVSQRRTITEGDFSAMVNLSWETSPLHTDREYAKTTQFGERILGGPCTIPFVAGLTGHAWQPVGESGHCGVGINNVTFTAHPK
jgi:acyl dehydratase